MKEIILNISYVLMVWGVAALLVAIPYIKNYLTRKNG